MTDLTRTQQIMTTAMPWATDAPAGSYDAIRAALEYFTTDADRYAFLAWLADYSGTAFLGGVKDAVVVANRPGRTYAETAADLHISTAAVNKAVTRHNRRVGLVQAPGEARWVRSEGATS